MKDYLDWQSELSLKTVFAGSASVSYPQHWRNGLLYITALEEEQGRVVVMFKSLDGQHDAICLTPATFNLGSKFSEYGGKPYWLIGDQLYFVNRSDQCLYQQRLKDNSASTPLRITPSPNATETLMFADIVQLSSSTLLAIVENAAAATNKRVSKKVVNDQENTSNISLIDLNNPNSELQSLRSGADFYSNLCIDPSRNRIAWVEWDHPNMPWDETQLWVADLKCVASSYCLENHQRIKMDASASVCQLMFDNKGQLFFSADFAKHESESDKNYWNIYMLDPSSDAQEIRSVTTGQIEFGYPHWQYGDARMVQLDDATLLTFGSHADGDVLCKIDTQTLAVTLLPELGNGYQNLSAGVSGCASAVLLSQFKPPELAIFHLPAEQFQPAFEVSAPLVQAEISEAQHIEFTGPSGEAAYGYYYAPYNSAYTVEVKVPPPLIVMVHGGPTARSTGFFDLQKQFWTQRGFAVFDVNHRGSSGYGRAFRDDLYGHWGEKDTVDIIAGIDHLVSLGKADVQRVCIRGKSAGGYAVLRALTQYPDTFRAGACYYGVGNLVTLAETTHKFEKHYADRMIGETYTAITAVERKSRFRTRSPIHDIEKLQCAMIVFQGLQDKVVPPAVAHEIISVLKQRKLPHDYVEYADEGHGFRQVNNSIDACTQELEFYRRNLRVTEIN